MKCFNHSWHYNFFSLMEKTLPIILVDFDELYHNKELGSAY